MMKTFYNLFTETIVIYLLDYVVKVLCLIIWKYCSSAFMSSPHFQIYGCNHASSEIVIKNEKKIYQSYDLHKQNFFIRVDKMNI